MNRIEIVNIGRDLVRGMAPHVASRKTANILREAVDELARECNWTFDNDGYYQTTCGNGWNFEGGEILDNGVVYCPYCGGIVTT
jgi:hypothetical protein